MNKKKKEKKERGKGSSGEATGTSKKLPELQPEKLTYRQLRQLKKRDLLQILLESEEELEFVKQQLQMERDLRAQYMCEPRSYQQAIHQQEASQQNTHQQEVPQQATQQQVALQQMVHQQEVPQQVAPQEATHQQDAHQQATYKTNELKQEDNTIVQPVNNKIESHEKQVILPSEQEENISDILSKMMNSKSSKRNKREKKSK